MTDTRRLIPRPFGRREFLAMGTGAFALAALPLALRRHVTVARRTLPVMGTIATQAARAPSAKAAGCAGRSTEP